MGDVTVLLRRMNDGDSVASEALLALVYAELTQLAARQLSREHHGHELEPHAVVHEAWLRMAETARVTWRDRSHFLAISARVMRQVLIDAARKRHALKRDGGLRVTLTGLALQQGTASTDVLSLHTALEQLAEIDPERARLVELRYFGGLTIEETAAVLHSSPATVKRNWEVARGWLYRNLSGGSEVPPA